MNIKTKLSLSFTLVVAFILIFFSLLTYYFSFTSQQSKFREGLLEKAKNSAILLIDITEVDSTLLKKIHQTTISLYNEEIAITNASLSTIYTNNLHLITDQVIKGNLPLGTHEYFSIGLKDGVVYRHVVNQSTFYVYVMAFDQKRTEYLLELKEILFWSIFFSVWLSVLFSYLFSKNAMHPITKIIKNVKEINSDKLNKRLSEGNKKDEIAQLAITFNDLLSKLEIVFKNQDDFVSNASHELRTPLSVMIGETDYLLNQPRTNEEYTNHLKKISTDLKELNQLINSLLELAQINDNDSIPFSPIRLDEMVQNAILQVKSKYPSQKIVFKITYPEDENDLLITGNAGLITIAIKNLIDNSCKFSNDDVIVDFKYSATQIRISIEDKGIGVPQQEHDNIFKPFNRASNAKYKSGFGIGLALVAKIIQLHKGSLLMKSIENKGTRFELTLNK